MPKLTLLLFLSALFSGCASAPHFQSSTTVESTENLEEGLMLCTEYRMVYPATRPIALRPYVDCMNEVSHKYPLDPNHLESSQSTSAVFREELSLIYGGVTDALWTPKLGLEIEAAIRAILRMICAAKTPSLVPQFAEIEKDNVLRHFPRTARILRTANWQVAELSLPKTKRCSANMNLTALDQQYFELLELEQSELEAISPKSRANEFAKSRYEEKLALCGEKVTK